MNNSRTLVMKFGGTSVGAAEAMAQAVNIIVNTRLEWPRLVVVTSALAGGTNVLLDSAVSAAVGDLNACCQAASELSRRHHALIDALIFDSVRRESLRQEVNQLIDEFINFCRAIHILGEATPRVLDAVAGLGERLSVRILAAAVDAAKTPAVFIESTQLIITDDHYQNAMPDMAETTQRVRQILNPLLAAGCVPVVTGFIGATPAGVTTTLGRGGSDYSASILAVALQSQEVWIWTDVDGVMTADPRLVPEARTIPILSYREVAEMAHYGARVLHPKSIHPVIEGGISLRVVNTFAPKHPGTRLVRNDESNGQGTIKAVTVIRGLQLVTLAGTGMLGVPGVAGKIFSAVAKTGVSIPLIIESSSEQAICFPVPQEKVAAVVYSLHADLSHEFQRGDIDRVAFSEDVDIITIISPGLRSQPGIAGQIFSMLGNSHINVLGISFGASDVSINLILKASDTQPALRALHTLIPE